MNKLFLVFLFIGVLCSTSVANYQVSVEIFLNNIAENITKNNKLPKVSIDYKRWAEPGWMFVPDDDNGKIIITEKVIKLTEHEGEIAFILADSIAAREYKTCEGPFRDELKNHPFTEWQIEDICSDFLAVDYLKKAGYDIDYATTFFKKMYMWDDGNHLYMLKFLMVNKYVNFIKETSSI